MAVSYSPLESKSGFKSPGFDVNSTNINVLGTISINGTPVFPGGGGSGGGESGGGTSWANVNVEGDFSVGEGSTNYINIINGQITITNRVDSVGNINNFNIGSTTPGSGTFTSITTTPLGIPKFESDTNLILSVKNTIVFQLNGSVLGRINASGSNIPVIDSSITNSTIDDTIIGGTTPSVGTFTEINIDNQPTNPSHATRKDYVDNKIAAFSIAFGA